MKIFLYILGLLVFFGAPSLVAQPIPIQSRSVDANGQVLLTFASTSAHYYVLHVRHSPTGDFVQASNLVMGKNGSTTISEPLSAYPLEHYQVTEHRLDAPADTDGDGVDDLTEWAERPTRSPFNVASPISFTDGATYITDRLMYKQFSYQGTQGLQNPALDNLELVKFYITERDSEEPKLYFINNNTHISYTGFGNALGISSPATLMTGILIYHPFVVAPNGTLGTYRFEFQPHNAFSFELIQMVQELLAANAPFLKNNLCYYPLAQIGLPLYMQEKAKYDASRVCVLFEQDIFADVDYLALNVAEGFGLLRVMAAGEIPTAREIVVYESLPNELPRVGGIITTVTQTPLSHVNLRAIQDGLPNAYIRDALDLPLVQSLVGKYVYFRAAQAGFTLREATLQEVEAWYDAIRPTQGLVPIRDLSQTKILPLDSISFQDSRFFGVKCANMATLRTFGFPTGTVPDGFGVPFYFYDEYMKYNGFYAEAQAMLANPIFHNNYAVQEQLLDAFRQKIKNGTMPPWMLAELGAMQQRFPAGTSIRCRSSTNNEDLPGFSGAGLYDSKTQHPNEGHISKSIRQIYASMWNFRAFDEREFYRIDHFQAAMGVLVHPNFDGERANGVAVTIDPIYQTDYTYYLNTQVGEDLVTNPDALSFPEEILLDAVALTQDHYFVMNPSSQVPPDTLIMREEYLNEIRVFLTKIHTEFAQLYNAVGKEGFAMEIEYKIDALGQLAIKQARPWAGFWAQNSPTTDVNALNERLKAYPNPFTETINLEYDQAAEVQLRLYNSLGQLVAQKDEDFRRHFRQWQLGHLTPGVYFLEGRDKTGRLVFQTRVVRAW